MSNPRDSMSDQPTMANVPVPAKFEAATFTLRVIEGPDTGMELVLEPSQPARLLVGKSPACDLKLSDPHVSRRHFSLELLGRRLRLRDHGSTNGTFIDGIGVVDGFLRGGEVIRVGSTAMAVAESGALQTIPLTSAFQFGRVLGCSTAMRRLYPLCERLAASNVPVVIEGETGTGKEQLAEALHEASPRASQPFVVFDCTAVAPSLIESELFGHERGAFTGSVASRRGVFERANGGTLLIDEIGDLPTELQPKLLRAIERGEVTRVGGEQAIRVDVRLLFATRRDLDRQVQLGQFRDDLFHRVAVTRIELPPLRERDGDVQLLAEVFATQLGADPGALPPELLARWEAYEWPGNVRELRNAVTRRVALGDMADDLHSEVPSGPLSRPPLPTTPSHSDPILRVLAMDLPLAEARQLLVDEFEARYVEHVLEQQGGNVTRAAAAAGVARRHLQRLRAKQRG
jgi:two-component system response regulator HydG